MVNKQKKNRLRAVVLGVAIVAVSASGLTGCFKAPESVAPKSTTSPAPASDAVSADSTDQVVKAAKSSAIFEKFIEGLNPEDVNSVSMAAKKLKSLATSDKEDNDRMLVQFEGYYGKVIEALNAEEPEKIETLDIALLKANGLRLNTSEAGSFVGDRPSYLMDQFGELVSPAKKERLTILREEALQVGTEDSGTYLLEDMALMISWNQLSERMVRWERYLDQYPDSTDRRAVEDTLKSYLWIYTASPLDNTPVYHGLKLSEDVRQSYEVFIARHADSKSAQAVKGYYDLLKKNHFKLSKEAIDYLNKLGVDTEALQQYLKMN